MLNSTLNGPFHAEDSTCEGLYSVTLVAPTNFLRGYDVGDNLDLEIAQEWADDLNRGVARWLLQNREDVMRYLEENVD